MPDVNGEEGEKPEALAADELADDSGASGDAHLQHDLSQEDLYGVGTDIHTRGDFLAGQPAQEEAEGLNLTIGEAVFVADVRQIEHRVMPALDE